MEIHFMWLDLIAPIGIAVLASFLAILSWIKGKELKGKIIASITALAFIALIPAMYYIRDQGLKPDYTNSYKIKVVQGKENKQICIFRWPAYNRRTQRKRWKSRY